MDGLRSAYASSPLLFWILGSFLLNVLGTNLFRLGDSEERRRSLRFQWTVQVGRFLYFLGIPYLVLGGWPRRQFEGLLGLEDLGLVGLSAYWPLTRWLEAAGTALGLGLVALLILALAWANANRGAGHQLHFSPRPLWVILADGLYLETHWAFYRAALAGLLDDFYAGIFWGLALVYLEWSLNPFWRKGWQERQQAPEQWLRAALALVIALLYSVTRNLWVCLGIHWLMELTLRQVGRAGAADHADVQIP